LIGFIAGLFYAKMSVFMSVFIGKNVLYLYRGILDFSAPIEVEKQFLDYFL
jgi:hypothetical protein